MSVMRLLIPHDGSKLSGAVVDAVLPLLGEDTEVTLLHVREEGEGRLPDEGLAESEQRLSGRGARVLRSDSQATDVAAGILEAAIESKADLVAMSTHGRSGLDRWVRGSVAERVLCTCPAPLLMVNPHTHVRAGFTSVLVPLDTSDRSTQILDPLIPLAQLFGARVTLLFVDWTDPTDTPAQATRRRSHREEDVAQWLSAPRLRIEAAGVRVETRVVQGDVAERILELARGDAFDLLALSTHGRSGPSRWILGSIATKVLRECRLPVLLKREVASGAGS